MSPHLQALDIVGYEYISALLSNATKQAEPDLLKKFLFRIIIHLNWGTGY